MHLELRAVAQLESLSMGNKAGVEPFVPSIQFHPTSKPEIPSYNPYDMSNKKVYDTKPPSSRISKHPIVNLEPLASASLLEPESLVHRKMHLDAYISGKKRLDSLPINGKSSCGDSHKQLTPIASETNNPQTQKGFNSSQPRNLNYPGRKQNSPTKKQGDKMASERAKVPKKPEVERFPVDTSHKKEDQHRLELNIHSRLLPEKKNTLVNELKADPTNEESALGINLAFDARFESILSRVSPPLNERTAAPILQSSSLGSSPPAVITNNVDPVSMSSPPPENQVNPANVMNKNEENPEQNDVNYSDEDAYDTDGFEEAYDQDEFEDADDL